MLSLVSVNIEWDKHLDTVLPFLKERNADVVCVQELLEPDIALFEGELGLSSFFTPNMLIPTDRGLVHQGNAILSRLPLRDQTVLKYGGSVGADYVLSDDPETWDKGYELRALMGASVEKEGKTYRIFTTHFDWTRDGESTPAQQDSMGRVLALLEKEEPFVLVGDFNAPRGRETFAMLAKRYRDNIPLTYGTSLDISVHKARHTAPERISRFMVDGLFTTKEYQATDVSLQFGISDHAAIVAVIDRL